MRALRPAVGMTILVVLVAQLGTGPFLDGVRRVDAGALAAATVAVAVATVCSAWRWSLVARALGIAVPLPSAVAAYYRSQFLNATLPGGVAGDVHRAVRHGQQVGDLGRSARAVAWERSTALLVHLTLTAVVVLLLPSPVRPPMAVPAFAVPAVAVTVVVLGAVGVAVVVGRAGSRHREGRAGRVARTLGADLRGVLLTRAVWPGLLVSSAVAATAHVTVFVVAAGVAGAAAPVGVLLPVACLVLALGAVPASVAGWGPREGAAAWVFGAAALGSAQGVTVAAAYGVMTLFATLPGALVLAAGWLVRRSRPALAAVPVEEEARG